MSDLKLFQLAAGGLTELEGSSMQMEKSLQTLFEANLVPLLGVRFLATEYSTGVTHGGRIDSLGLDEDGSPVIIEYKRAVNENVINQGLFYLDWLLDHKKEFQWLVMERFGPQEASDVDWSGPRLICVAGDFTKYDEHAVRQINRNIELLRYRRFGSELLLIEQVFAPRYVKIASTLPNSGTVQFISSSTSSQPIEQVDKYLHQRIEYRLANAPLEVKDLYEAVRAFLSGLGDDVQEKTLKMYVAFKRIKNFACVEVYTQVKCVTTYLKVDPDTVGLEEGFSRDVRKIGHFGTGDLELTLRNMDDFAKAQPLFQRAYEGA